MASKAPRRSRSDVGRSASALGRRPGRPFEPCLAAYAQRLRTQEAITDADVQQLLAALWGFSVAEFDSAGAAAAAGDPAGSSSCIGGFGGGGAGGSLKRRDSLVGALLRRSGRRGSSGRRLFADSKWIRPAKPLPVPPLLPALQPEAASAGKAIQEVGGAAWRLER